MKCKNKFCKYHSDGHCDKKRITIGENGKCEQNEKGFLFYFYAFELGMRDNANFITAPDLTNDVKYSIYYLMKCLPIEFACDDVRGILLLRHRITKKILHKSDIYGLIRDEMDSDALHECITDFTENGLPKTKTEDGKKVTPEEAQEEFEKNHPPKEYGWLSPTGTFYEVKWGDHEEWAYKYIEKRHMKDQYREWQKKCHENGRSSTLARDFLCEVKGWVLIDSPTTMGYHVISMKPMTKKQKEFLYGYFYDMGMKSRAEQYLEEE